MNSFVHHRSLTGVFKSIEERNRKAAFRLMDNIRAMPLDQIDAQKEEIETLLTEYFYDAPETHLRWAEKLLTAGRKNDAMRFVYAALKHAGFDKKPAVLYGQVIQVLIRNGFNDIAAVVQKAKEKNFCDNAYVIVQTANTYLTHEPHKAIALLEEARANHPGDPVMINTLGNAYVHSGEPHKAIALLEKARANHPGDPVMIATLGNAYLHSGEPHKAIALLEKARANHPGNPVMINTLGNAYLHSGEPHKAIALLEKARANHPGDPVMIATLGNAYLHSGEPHKAIALLEKARANHPGNPVMINTLGNAYVLTLNRIKFDSIKNQITLSELRDYLDAKLYYLSNDSLHACKILTPHVQNITDCRKNMLGLYMACLGDDHGIHALLPTLHGADNYAYLIQCRDEWRASPARMELPEASFDQQMPRFFDLGANPVSGTDRSKAGMGRGVPVATPRRWQIA